MTNYLLDSKFDQTKHYAPPKTMFIDDRIIDNKKEGGHMAVILYMGFLDKISLSKSKHEKGGTNAFINADGQYFCRLSESDAKKEMKIKRDVCKDRKAFLKKIGLIDYDVQKEKKDGCASEITITPWDLWVEQNGLYSNGEWIKEPSSKGFYNPEDIVKVQPTFKKKVEKVEPASDEDVEEFETLMTKAKSLGVKYHKAGRVQEVYGIVLRNFGIGKKLTEAIVEDLPKLRIACRQLENEFNNVDSPDF